MLELFQNLSEDEANKYGLVLSSSGISYHLKKGGSGWYVWVDDMDYETALNTIEQYLEENKDFDRKDEVLYFEYQKTLTGLWVSIGLLACYVTIKTGDDFQLIVNAYGSSAFHILHGELYRTVTSLMIHANTLHLSGNILGIAIFGTAVCTTTGWGAGWLMILATGIVGNLLNAILYKTGHLSIGASTAVFGAIGILAAHQFFRKLGLPGQRIRAWLPLAGGITLLGILGSGEFVDLTAHLFGFMAGIVIGALYAILLKEPISKSYQVYCLLATLGVLVMSWIRAFNYR